MTQSQMYLLQSDGDDMDAGIIPAELSQLSSLKIWCVNNNHISGNS